MMRRRIVLVCVVITLSAANLAAAQKPTLADVLERAGEYVAGFERQFSVSRASVLSSHGGSA